MKGRKVLLLTVILLAGTLAIAGQGLVSKLEVLLQLSGIPVPASSAMLSEHELEEINAMAPQDQAMRLMERYADRYPFDEMVTHEFGLADADTAMRTSMSPESMKVTMVPSMV